MENRLKSIRTKKGLTQEQTAKILGVSRRTYIRYENCEALLPEIKLNFFYDVLEKYGLIDEEHGVLTIGRIKEICTKVCKDYQVEFCYLFGSYAKNKATEKSDVDLLVSMPTDGMKFFELVEVLREQLRKKADLLDISQLEGNPTLVHEILNDGLKIYG